jgi:hypothetical protein
MPMADAQEWMGRTADELRHTAYHEAAHAVINRVVGMLCGEATIVPDHEGMLAGFSITHDPWAVCTAWERGGKYRGHHYESVLRGRIIGTMAGHEAQTSFSGLRTIYRAPRCGCRHARPLGAQPRDR